jgi:hypothetical protein
MSVVMIKPLHVASIGGHPVRFFRTPNNDGRPDLPWHAVDDLYRALELNREQRKGFLHMLRKRGGIRTLATSDGIVIVAPHFIAQGCIDAMIDVGVAPSAVRIEYDLASTEAVQKLIPHHLPFPSDDWVAWMKAAMNRHNA